MTNLKLAFRRLLNTPFVSAVAVVSLALGIGANAAIFSLFNELLRKPLPVPDPYRMVNLEAPGPKPGSQSCNNAGGCDVVFSYPMFRDLQKAQTVFTNIAAHRSFGANLASRGQTLSGEGMLVSGSYFQVLGIQPAIGRLIAPEDDRAVGEAHVVVLGYGYWQSRFGGNTSVLGEQMIVNGQSMTIVGVAPQEFEGTTIGTRPQVYVPITMRGLMNPGFDAFHRRNNYWAYLFARLRPGVSIEQARAALNTRYHGIVNDVEASLQRGMSDQTLKRFRAKEVRVVPGERGQSSVSREARAPLFLLLGVTALVLLIACANIANLLLARAAARAVEMAIRLSIGAGRRQLISQLLTESLVLAALGGAAGVVVARWTLDLIAALLPAEAASTLQFRLDGEVLLFTALVTLGTGLLFGLFPALHSTRSDLLSTLKGQSGQPSGARGAARFRASLATAQIALSMALLVAAGLFTKSLFNVARVELGINVDNLVTFGISPELNGYTPERSRVLFSRLEERLAGVPSVQGVTASMVPALAGSNWGSDVAVEGFKGGPDIDSNARFNEVGAGYFRTMGIPVLTGREFRDADALSAPKVAVVNEAFAKKFNLGRNAVGKRIGTGRGFSSELDTEIVGLVQNAKYSDVKDPAPPLFFRPYRQDDEVGSLTFYVRTSMDPEEFLANIPRVVREFDPNLPVENLRTMPQQVRDNVFLDRFITVLSAAFAVLATLLAAVGLYGVLAYTVAQRTREIGLRMALGAAPARVRSMVLKQVGVMIAVGGSIGLAAAVWLGFTAQSMLFELKSYDPVVLAGSAILLAIVAMVAGFIPARRASNVEPMWALRYE
ncbi:MAG TPA: ABC transporter permease [Vicinamibacterales bacterium]|nr:ABC transporter permease [Vicinamibacterales bacterium]